MVFIQGQTIFEEIIHRKNLWGIEVGIGNIVLVIQITGICKDVEIISVVVLHQESYFFHDDFNIVFIDLDYFNVENNIFISIMVVVQGILLGYDSDFGTED